MRIETKEKRSLIFLIGLLILATYFASAAEYSGFAQVEFTTSPIICQRTATTAFWVNSSTNTIIANASNNCSLFYNLTKETCCPNSTAYMKCDNNVCGSGAGVTRCDQYNTSSSCKLDSLHVGASSVPNPSMCGASSSFVRPSDLAVCFNVSDCRCKWIGTAANGSCSASINYSVSCLVDGNPDFRQEGECWWSISSTTDNCNTTNTLTINSVANWYGGIQNNPKPEWCADTTKTYQCPPTTKLDFISNLGIVIIIILLIAVYFYLLKRRKTSEKSRKAKKK